MRKKGYELTEAEWAIMRAVWEHEPCAAPTIREVLQDSKNWAYSTVHTIMQRMVGKGLLSTERIRNLTLYRSAIIRSQAQRGEVSRTLKRAFDGALTPMMQFLINSNNLSRDELNKLRTLIEEKEKKRVVRKRKK